MALDLTTLYVVAGLGMLVAGLVHLIPVATGRFGRWATWWGSGHLIVGLTALVAVLNDRIGFGWAPNIGNPLAVMGYAVITGAVMKFDRPDARLTRLLAIAAVVAAPLMVCGDAAHFHLRVTYLSVVRAAFDIAVVTVAVRLACREGLQTGWIIATLFAITVPLFLGRAWLAYDDRIGSRLIGMQDNLGAWLAAGQIAFIIFRAFSLLILQAERGQNALRDQMERDWLTGALNRAGFDRIAAALAYRAAAHRTPARRISVMMLDVDRFKALNDSHGHAAGDAALRTLADIAHAAIGKQGHLVRWGGDEFVCLLPDLAIDRARMIGTDIAGRFADAMAAQATADAAPGVSIGVVEGDIAGGAGDTGGITDLIARADHAMYIAKGDRRRTPVALFKAA
ncbi:GGDEF domain-containing protein [Sphingomonas sp. 4RDLI-65]|uniref:GGDEF domain-containing protein n=1 Tax=Sphingomonas sp. 4RDLI-65 TaxID=3111641 RepID=UPI003C1F0989